MGKAKKAARPSKVERVAYHEAGHVVMAVLLRIPIRYATIIPDLERNFLGCVFVGPNNFNPGVTIGDDGPRFVEKRVLFSWGGIVAEAFFTKRQNWRWASFDVSSIVESAIPFCGEEKEAAAYIAWLRIRTMKTLAMPENWRAVEAVAAALLEHRRLPGSRLKAIAKSAMAKPDESTDLASWQQRLASI